LADHAQDAIDILADRRATVVGHSYGGVVALMVAVLQPELVTSLAVFEPTVPFTDWWPDYDEMMRRSADLKPMMARWSTGQARRTPEQRAADERSMARDFSFVETAPFEFSDVTVPCLVGGSVDTTPWDFQSADRLSELLGADVVMFGDAGHTVHRTHPREFADFARRAVALAR
jgi:pimeloyl-ACP methyl ester carboxylesterase